MTEFREIKLRGERRTRRVHGLRFAVLDARSPAVRRRIAAQTARLDPEAERDALDRNEAVSEFGSEDLAD
jgi:hypothetical protein